MSRTPIGQALRSTISKWDLMKSKNFSKAKDTVNRTQVAVYRWEKIFTNSTSDRGSISKIYKELKKLDIDTRNNPIKNGVQI